MARPIAETGAGKAVVQVVLWTALVKVALFIGGLQAAAVQYLVNG